MKRSCDKCGFPRLPIHEKCTKCGQGLLSPEEAKTEEAAWSGIPEVDRRPLEEEYERRVSELGAQHASGRRMLLLLMGIGALFCSVLTAFTLPELDPTSAILVPCIGILAGAAGGWVLWKHGSGLLRGALAFGWSFPATLMIAVMTGATSLAVALTLCAFYGLAGFALGALLGLWIENR